MNQKVKNPFDDRMLPVRLIWGSVRFLIFGIVILIFLTGILLVRARWQEATQVSQINELEGDPNLGAAERLVLQTVLTANRGNINAPVGDGSNMVEFVIEPGQNANQIAINLSRNGVISPARESLFINYLRYYGLDARLVAGKFQVSPAMTMPALVGTLINPTSQDITLTFLKGWRVEEYANYLATVKPANIDADQFLAIVRREVPVDVSAFSYLADLPNDTSLEGYLFPDSYTVPTDADALLVINMMLQNFDRQVTPAMRQNFGSRGLTIPQAVTLASIVEREAVQPEERPTIASVFLNRLGQNIKLDADPTVQYAVGYTEITDSWWKVPLSLADLQSDSPYNTYLYVGLPPTPISNPGFGSLDAVARPAETEFLYFVAECRGYAPGSHLFSVTYDEHLQNVENCR